MPAPIVLQDPFQQSLGQGITGASNVLAQALQKRGDKQRQQTALSSFQEALEVADGDPNLINKALMNAAANNVNPNVLQSVLSTYKETNKNNAFSSAYDQALQEGGIDTETGKAAFLKQYTKKGGSIVEGLKVFETKKGTQSVFDKKIDEYKANAVIDYMQGGNEADVNFSENLDFLEKNLPSVGYQKSLSNIGPFKSQMFSEYENRGNLVLDRVIKIFNRSGVLPQKKLEWLKDTFSVSPNDYQNVIKGKINALRTLSKKAESLDNRFGQLVEKYGADIPNDEFIKLSKESAKTLEKYDQAVQSPEQENVVNKLPSKAKTGAIATDTKSGQKYKFNGKRWVKMGS